MVKYSGGDAIVFPFQIFLFFASDFFVDVRSQGKEDWTGLMPFTRRGGGGGGGGGVVAFGATYHLLH